MSSEDKSPGHKRGIDESEEEIVGPLLSEAIAPKKQKVLEFEKLYLRNLPSTEYYEKSFMHRDVITHIIMAKTDFLITASCDGHVKFWKKMDGEIEFVKHFRAHMGTILDMSGNADGTLCCTASDDKALKVFDVVNFDMINMLKLGYVPSCCCWIHSPGDAISAVAIAEKDTHKISIYDGRGTNQPLKVLDRMHQGTVNLIRYNPVYEVVISSDNLGMLEYWTSYKTDCEMPKVVAFDSKFDTDLYEFFQKQTYPVDITFSPNGQMFASMGRDRQVRIFNFITGKLKKVIDESLQSFTELQQTKQQLPSMEFGRRMATEKDLERSEAFMRSNIVFDESGHFILFATMLGIKVVNLVTNKCVRFIGRPENTRFLTLALYQGHPRKMRAEPTMEMHASENPTLASSSCTDPTICCTAYKKNRFYIFTQREPIDVKSTEGDRDVLNERPSREELVSATEGTASSRLAASAVIHTTMGDLHIKLFYKECPKSVENFVVHSRNGYYNGHLIHRVIKQFMIQTGDPLGNGTGGESIWGGEFQDEFHPSLKHDRPYTVSMANAGPNTNGSQFFITVIPCPWLDNKHTVFGRISRGMDVVQKMNDVKTDKKTDKPLEEIRIISVTVK